MRKLDRLGRVCLPKDIREKYELKTGSDMQVIDNGNSILVIPFNRPYSISSSDMESLRKMYIMLKDSGLLDEEYCQKLAKITRETETKCATCKSKMFLTNDNTYKCYKCD